MNIKIGNFYTWKQVGNDGYKRKLIKYENGIATIKCYKRIPWFGWQFTIGRLAFIREFQEDSK